MLTKKPKMTIMHVFVKGGPKWEGAARAEAEKQAEGLGHNREKVALIGTSMDGGIAYFAVQGVSNLYFDIPTQGL